MPNQQQTEAEASAEESRRKNNTMSKPNEHQGGEIPHDWIERLFDQRNDLQRESARLMRERDQAIQSGNDIRVERNELEQQRDALQKQANDSLMLKMDMERRLRISEQSRLDLLAALRQTEFDLIGGSPIIRTKRHAMLDRVQAAIAAAERQS